MDRGDILDNRLERDTFYSRLSIAVSHPGVMHD